MFVLFSKIVFFVLQLKKKKKKKKNIKQKTHVSEEKYHCRGLLSDPTSNSHNKYLRNFIENNRAKTPMVIPNSPDELP